MLVNLTPFSKAKFRKLFINCPIYVNLCLCTLIKALDQFVETQWLLPSFIFVAKISNERIHLFETLTNVHFLPVEDRTCNWVEGPLQWAVLDKFVKSKMFGLFFHYLKLENFEF